MDLTLYRGEPFATEIRNLPASIYNPAHCLAMRSAPQPQFVPIRSMQYLSILERHEIVFVDSRRRNAVVLTWSQFCPHARRSLLDPVPYTASYFEPEAKSLMARLHSEFPKALQILADKVPPVTGGADVLSLAHRAP